MNPSYEQPAAKGLRVLAVMRLGNRKAADHLRSLVACPRVEHVTLVRHAPVAIDSPKLTQAIHRSTLDEGVGRLRLSRSLKNVAQCFFHGCAMARRDRARAVVGFNFTPYGVIAWLIAKCSGARAVASLIGADFNTRLRAPIYGLVLCAILRRCDRVTVFGDDARQTLADMGVRPERIFVLPNSVDTERYRPDPREPARYDVVCTGYLIRRKNVDQLLRAMRVVIQSRPRTRLLVIGDGVERAALESLARKLEIDHAVTFTGWTDDVPRLLRQAKIFALLSEAEGLPMAMLEATCTGLPAVVTDVGANRAVIEDGINGYLLPLPVDPHQVADRLLKLLDDNEHYRRCADQALKTREAYGYDAAARVWDRVLDGL